MRYEGWMLVLGFGWDWGDRFYVSIFGLNLLVR